MQQVLNSPKPATQTETESAIDFESMVLEFNDLLLVMDTQVDSIIWCSPAFQQKFAMTDTDIDKLFDGFEGGSELLATMNRAHTIEAQASLLKQRDVFHRDSRCFYDIDIIQIKTGHKVFRFSMGQHTKEEISRYLSDREKLFSTSRAISVSEMATALAHELNQPIGTITNLLQGVSMRLQKQDNCRPDLLDALAKAINQAGFAASIISRIRDYTQSYRPNYQVVLLNQLISSSVDLLDWEISKESIQIVFDVEANAGLQVLGDETMLQQVVVNLLRNSIDAMKDNARDQRTIAITLKDEIDNIEISISDTGVGLSEEVKDNLFVPFASSKTSGMGIGLNICRSFIELHQGRLWLASNTSHLDKHHRFANSPGCTAFITLPAVAPSDTFKG